MEIVQRMHSSQANICETRYTHLHIPTDDCANTNRNRHLKTRRRDDENCTVIHTVQFESAFGALEFAIFRPVLRSYRNFRTRITLNTKR